VAVVERGCCSKREGRKEVKNVTLVDPSGKDVSVSQEQVIPLLRSGFGVRAGQRVTLGDQAGTEVPIENLVDALNKGLTPTLESQRASFQREAEQRFGGGAGLAAGLGYGALQGASLGLGGRALIESGLVSPETLAQLEEARGGGMFSTIGAGELIGGTLAFKGAGKLLGPAAGSAAEAALLEREAAKSAGRRIAETAAKEAGIGAGYAAGSELTQAGIERRQANLGEAALAGAEVGGILGAAGSTLVEGAARAKARGAAAAERRAAEDIAGIPSTTTEDVDRAAAQARKDAEKQKIQEYAKNASANLAGIVERINNAATQADDLGYSLSGKGLKKLAAKVERLQESYDSIGQRITDEYTGEVERLNKTLADVQKTAFKNKSARLADEQTLAAEYQAAKDDLALAQSKKAGDLAIQSAQTRVSKLEKAMAAFTEQETMYTELGKKTLALADIVGSLGKEQRGKARELSRAEAVRRQLSNLGEKSAELAGGEAQAARDEAKELLREVNVLKEQAGVASSDAARTGVKAGSRYGEEFAQPTVEAAKGPLDSFRSIVGDMFTVERGLFKEGVRAAEGEAKKGASKVSVFTQLFNEPVVRQSLSAENAAYVRAIAAGAKDVDLIRGAHHKSTRAKGLVTAIDEQFAKEGGLESVLGPQRYAEITDAAMSDARAILANEPTEQMANDVLARYREARLPAETVEAPAVEQTLADSQTITAANPAETESLRAKLAQHEANIAKHDEAIATLGDQRAKAFEERRAITDKLANAKTATRKAALADSLAAATEREKTLQTSLEAVESSRAEQQQAARARREMRAINAVDAATDAENAAAARQSLADARRAVDKKVLSDKRDALGRKLDAAKNAQTELQRIIGDHKAARQELEALISKGENYVRSTAGGRLVPLAEEQIFERRFADFMRSPEGRDIAASLRDVAPASKGSITPKDVAGILGIEVLASSLLGPALGTVATGLATAAMSGKKGVWLAAKTLMNPIKFWSASENTLKAMSQLTTESGRRSEMRRGYQFPVAEANAYLDSIVEDRASADKAFSDLVKTGSVNAKNVEEAKRRFDAAVDYLERKRPPTMNGADAQAFARSVALLKDPNLLATFVRDGSLRQQDVDLLQRISPESYDQLKSAVTSLHQQRPAMVANLAPLFKIMLKDKYMVRTNLSLLMLQQLGGASFGQEQGQGEQMQPKSETMAARGRAASAKDSPTSNAMAFSDQGELGK
jgi:hypothetical protein